MKFGSVCSGIEAASVAWHPIGWTADWLAEIEPFPSAVLAHHYPEVANLGDMTKLADMVANDNISAPDVLVGGTPCQAFSVAGARKGLADERGILTIKFVELANAIDSKRADNDNEPAIIVWENVPGVLSSKDNAFGAFLGLLSGEDCELVPPGGKWSNAGYVHGPQRTIAWRILDAQYFGVAQRRRRVFVVASARTGFDPTKVLFEFDGVRRDSAPSREARQIVAALTANGVGTCGADDNQGQAGHLIPQKWPAEIACTLNAAFGQKMGLEDQHVNGGCPLFVPVQSIHGTQDPIVASEMAHCLGRNNGQENAVCVTGEITHTLKAEGFDGSEDGTGRGQPIVAAFAQNSRDELRYVGEDGQIVGALSAQPGMKQTSFLQAGMQVRRLTPIECERLQGFPDNYTLVPVGKKEAADGPRYKALGNSMAVPCMHWIGRRIQAQIADNDNKATL
jgi:DNA (cytosine-5)-methyltransferase 1